jgi:diguanylate cyclase (GGDEF)-like protein/PAS domain S-box-containing protein
MSRGSTRILPGHSLSEAERRARLDALRHRAEAALSLEGAATTDPGAASVIENLRIYQVELELQNEELREAQAAADLARGRYQSLFDHLPLPALVVDQRGLTVTANQRAIGYLGSSEPGQRLDPLLFRHLNDEDRARLHSGLREVDIQEPVLIGNLTLRSEHGRVQVFDAHLIRLPMDYHLNGHVAVLLADRTGEQQRLREQRLFNSMLDSSDAQIYAVDTEGRFLLANRAMLEFLGKQAKEVLGQTREAVMPLRDAIRQRADDVRVLQSREGLVSEEEVYVGGEAGTLNFVARRFPLFNLDGEVYGVGVISTDVTREREHQRELLLSEAVFMSASEAIFITDTEARILRVNPAFCRLSGFSESAVIGYRANILKSGRQGPHFYRTMWQALIEKGHWEGELTNRSADGRLYTVWSSLRAVRNRQGEVSHYVAVQSDITELRQSQARATRLASYDPLTGLPNRSQFNDRIVQLISVAQDSGRPFALLFVDLDHFKEVNDSLGHPVGDEMLKAIAQRLLRSLRAEDTVARMGGDEFVVLLPGADAEQAQKIGQKLLEKLHAPLELGPLSAYRPMASVGIAVFPRDGDTPDLLLRNADTAMYAAKLGGRNRVMAYTASMSEQSSRVFAVQNELTRGIENGELRLFLQPKVDLSSGRLIGAEGLVRWERPGHGLMSPVDFLPVAERNGLVIAIDRWMLREGLRQIALWRAEGLWAAGNRLALNLHAQNLHRPELVSEMAQLLDAQGVPAECLEIEVTEAALLEHTDEIITRLEQLRALGVSLAIDDFGTGYSSLAYLNRMPFSVIKIDQSFVREMLLDKNGRVLVETIILMAHKLGHTVVAEGVEEEAQRIALQALGCEAAQGWLFGRAMAVPEFRTTQLRSQG